MHVLKSYVLIFLVGAIFLLSSCCMQKPIKVSTPPIRPDAAESLAKADAHMRDAHLFAWKQAESLYQTAYVHSPSDEIRNKLLLVRFLILVRQADEDIPYAAAESVIRDLCAGDQYQKNLCAAATWIQNGRKPGQLKLSPPIFRGQDPGLESYINLLLFQAVPRFDAFPMTDAPAATDSPLFLYLNTTKLYSMNPADFDKKYPQFAEGYEYIADNFYQKKQYRQALAFYQKAVDLIPEYTNALVGLGNLSFYVLEDYVRAIRYYDTALKRDPSSASALFGKSLVLQQLGEYAESNAVLNRMLAGGLSRNKWIEGIPDSQYYQGEGNYLKAYNFYLMNDRAKGREFVDAAAKFMPDAAEIHYLSGLLFFESKDLEAARRDFLRVAQTGNYNCNAQLNLGFIYEQLKEMYGTQPADGEKEPPAKKSLEYFVAAASCMDAVVGSLSYQIKTLNTVDLDPPELTALKARLEKKLAEVRLSSTSTFERIIDRIGVSSEPERDLFLKHVKDILNRFRSQ